MKPLYFTALSAALLITACKPASQTRAADASGQLCIDRICYADNADDFVAALPAGMGADVADDDGMSYAQLTDEVDINGLGFMVSYVHFGVTAQRAEPLNMVLFMREDVDQDIENCQASVSQLAAKFAAQGLSYAPGPHRHSFSASEDYQGTILSTEQIENSAEGFSLTAREVDFDGVTSTLISTQSQADRQGVVFQIEAVNAGGNCDIFMSLSSSAEYGTYDLLSEF